MRASIIENDIERKIWGIPGVSDGLNSSQEQNRKNYKFAISVFRVVMTQCSLGPAPNPGIFLGIARKIIVASSRMTGLLHSQGELDQGSVGTQPWKEKLCRWEVIAIDASATTTTRMA